MPRYLPHAMAIALSIISAVSSNGAEEAGRQAEDVASVEGVDRIGLLPPGPDNPRNSEGDFIELKDDRVLFVYSHFFGGGGDHSAAHLAGRFSSDGGRTWSDEDVVVVPKEGDWNVMSVSLLRLASDKIALFYLRKNSLTDCRPYMRISTDEAKSWSEPKLVIDDKVGYYVLNNDRVVQLASGRLIAPVALHNLPEYDKPDWAGTIMCYVSDDEGRSWRRSKDQLVGKSPDGKRVTLQEPGVIELKDKRLMMFCRTTSGCQYISFSEDGGDTWTQFEPSNIVSPCSPASIERIPKIGDLLLVWNNHENVDAAHRGKRTPYNVAISRDEGRTWESVKTLEDDPNGWYCYTAVDFVGDHVLLGHCAGDRRTGGLSFTQITRFPVAWIYK
ncbi:MAG: exo-alpha-sialidase [Pirellulaceae bacterium]|nr:exo-alpha-sialidase [Pirellulaceae bacterium]